MARRLSLLGILVLAVAALAACGGGAEESAQTTEAAPATTQEPAGTGETGETGTATTAAATAAPLDPSVCQGASLSFIGLAGEEGEKELKQWRDENGVMLQVNNVADWGQLIGAIKTGQPHDLSTIPYWQAQRMIEAGTFLPIDVSKLSNWNDIAPALRESDLLRGQDGQIYGVPIAWGDGPYVYAPERVQTPPKSVVELLEPEWTDRFVLFDDPSSPFFMLALANGFTDAPLLTPDQLATVKEQAKQLVDNAAAFETSYQDATDRLVAGDIDLALGGWEAMLTWAEEKGVTLDYDFLTESKGGGWWDGLAIPVTAENPECALAYIDQMISPETQAKLATNLISGAANPKAADSVGPDAQIYDYSLVSSETPGIEFVNVVPPEEPPAGYASFQDWQDAWQEIKAG